MEMQKRKFTMNQITMDYQAPEQVIEENEEEFSSPEQETGNDLLVVEPDKARIVKMFSEKNGLDPIIEEIKKKVGEEVFDVASEKGRERIGSVARQIGSAKKFMERSALELTEGWRSKTAAVNAEKKRMIEEMDLLRDSVLAPRLKFDQIEKDRKSKHENGLTEIESLVVFDETPDSDVLKQRIQKISLYKNRDWQEFEDRYNQASDRVEKRLNSLLEERVKYEKEQAELERLRKEKQERKQKEHEERLKKEAAETARLEAEAKAKAEREAAEKLRQEEIAREKADRDRVEREKAEAEQRAKDAEEKAKADAAKAEQEKKVAAERAEREKREAVEAERKRQEDEKAKAEAERQKRESDKAHHEKINSEARDDIMLALGDGYSEELAKSVVEAIAKGKIRNVKIQY